MRKFSALVFSLIFIFWSAPFAFSASTTPKLIVAIDTSGSMHGVNDLLMQDAVIDLVVNPVSNYQVDLYTFGKSLNLLASSNEQQSDVIKKIRAISSSGETALYDSIIQALPLANNPQDKIVFLTDGLDSISRADINEVEKKLVASKVKIDFFMNQLENRGLETLSNIATVAGGRVFTIDQISVFRGELSAPVTNFETQIPNSPKKIPNPDTTPSIIFISSAVGLLSLFALGKIKEVRGQRNMRAIWSNSLDSYAAKVERSKSNLVSKQNRRKIEEFANKVLGDLSYLFSPGRNQVLIVGILALLTLLIGKVLWSAGIPLLVNIVITSLLVALLIRKFIQSRVNSLIRDFEADLPNSLKMLAAGLGSGLSFLQALESLTSDLNSEVNRQFRRALTEIQMGTPVEKALMSVAERMKSKDLEWAVFAFNVQREVGGSLSRILQTTAESIESRANVRREIRTLSAEGRLSIYILMLLPIVVLLFFSFVRPDFLKVFWNEPIGNVLIFTVIAFITISWFWMKRLIRIEV